RHYSLAKAADLLGVGRQNLIPVDVDAMFRLDVRSLEEEIRKANRDGRSPLAVVAITGTTEVGAVDPVDRVVALREVVEKSLGESFWLHIDAAWGGYLRTLFSPPEGVGEFVSRDLAIERGRYSKQLRMKWGSPEVHAA